MPELKSTFVQANGLKLHVMQAGQEDGKPVLLLHGFPEGWYGWRHQIPALADAGFRVYAPDQRGYNLSDKPCGVAPYRYDHAAADAAALIEILSPAGKAFIVAHDWGAIAAWHLAMTQPERIEKLVVMNVPHPQVITRALRTNPRQMYRSLYALAIQLPRLPERFMLRDDCKRGKQALVSSARPGTFSEAELADYCLAWSQPDAMTSMLNWYRAAFRHGLPRVSDWRVHIPTRIIWGKQDTAIIPELAAQSAALCDDAQLFMLDDATHWLQHEEPQQVNALILDFLSASK